jgi:hypothetical protein
LVLVGAAAALAVFLILRSDDEPQRSVQPTTSVFSTIPQPPPPPPRPRDIVIPISTDALRRATIPQGRRVVLVVSGAPAGEEIHLHGYDVKRRVGPEGTARLAFRATIPGRFEVELEASHRQIADLTVR